MTSDTVWLYCINSYCIVLIPCELYVAHRLILQSIIMFCICFVILSSVQLLVVDYRKPCCLRVCGKLAFCSTLYCGFIKTQIAGTFLNSCRHIGICCNIGNFWYRELPSFLIHSDCLELCQISTRFALTRVVWNLLPRT